jgi:hypothetical protein
MVFTYFNGLVSNANVLQALERLQKKNMNGKQIKDLEGADYGTFEGTMPAFTYMDYQKP